MWNKCSIKGVTMESRLGACAKPKMTEHHKMNYGVASMDSRLGACINAEYMQHLKRNRGQPFGRMWKMQRWLNITKWIIDSQAWTAVWAHALMQNTSSVLSVTMDSRLGACVKRKDDWTSQMNYGVASMDGRLGACINVEYMQHLKRNHGKPMRAHARSRRWLNTTKWIMKAHTWTAVWAHVKRIHAASKAHSWRQNAIENTKEWWKQKQTKSETQLWAQVVETYKSCKSYQPLKRNHGHVL